MSLACFYEYCIRLTSVADVTVGLMSLKSNTHVNTVQIDSRIRTKLNDIRTRFTYVVIPGRVQLSLMLGMYSIFLLVQPDLVLHPMRVAIVVKNSRQIRLIGQLVLNTSLIIIGLVNATRQRSSIVQITSASISSIVTLVLQANGRTCSRMRV